MIIYLVVSLMPLILSSFYFSRYKMTQYKKKQFLILYGILLVLFIGFRNRNIGSSDSLNYYNMFLDAIKTSSLRNFYNPNGVEIGFQLFLWIFSRFINNPQWIFIISAIIYITCISIFIYNNSDDVILSYTLYITLGLMIFMIQGMRQSIAMSICLLSFEFVKAKKFKQFLLFILLAMMFHQTAIVFIAVYFLLNLKIKVTHISTFLFFAFISLFFINIIISYANKIFNRSYTDTADSGGFVAVAIYLLIIIFDILFNKDLKRFQYESTFFYMLLLGFFSYIMRYVGALAAERISFYFMFSQLIILPNTITKLPLEEKRIIRPLIYFFAICLFVYRLRDSNLVPYRFFWEV